MIRLNFNFLVFVFIVLLFSGISKADVNHLGQESHRIDNLSYTAGFGATALDPHHQPIHDQGTPWAEGQPTNSCFANATTNPSIGMGKTFRELHQWAWHWRRVIVNKTTYLSGMVNRAKALTQFSPGKSHIPVPFWDYDPFSYDPYFQGVVTWPQVYHPILIDYYNLSPWRGNDYSWDANTTKYVWFLEAQHSFNHSSFLVGAPAKYDGVFNYYDRIPASPTFDPCIAWLEGRVSWDYVLEIAAAHELAGRDHLALIEKRIIYLWPFETLVLTGVIR